MTGHRFVRPGQVRADLPPPDYCVVCGASEAAHRPVPRADGSIGASHVRPDGTAQLSHEDLLTVLGALADAVDFTTPVMRVKYRALLYRLGDDR